MPNFPTEPPRPLQRLRFFEIWNAPGMVGTAGSQNEACSKTSGLTPPIWPTVSAFSIVERFDVIEHIGASHFACLADCLLDRFGIHALGLFHFLSPQVIVHQETSVFFARDPKSFRLQELGHPLDVLRFPLLKRIGVGG